MKARRVVKKAATRKAKRHYAVRSQRLKKAFARKKGRPSQGVIDLFVSTYETLG